MYDVHVEETRRRYRHEVRWNGGRAICRANSRRDAQRIANALNVAKDLDAPLSPEEIQAVEQACPYSYD